VLTRVIVTASVNMKTLLSVCMSRNAIKSLISLGDAYQNHFTDTGLVVLLITVNSVNWNKLHLFPFVLT